MKTSFIYSGVLNAQLNILTTTETLRKIVNDHRHDAKDQQRKKSAANHAKFPPPKFCTITYIFIPIRPPVMKSLPKEKCNVSLFRKWELAKQYVRLQTTS